MSELVLTDKAALALIDQAEQALAQVENPEDADELWRKVKAVEEAARLASELFPGEPTEAAA